MNAITIFLEIEKLKIKKEILEGDNESLRYTRTVLNHLIETVAYIQELEKRIQILEEKIKSQEEKSL